MPELPEMEITARRLGEALTGETIESARRARHQRAQDLRPAAHALDGRDDRGRPPARQAADARRPAALTLLMHLMSAGRLQLFAKRATLRDRTSRLLAAAVRATASCGCASSGPAARVGEAAHARGGRRRRGAQPRSGPRRGPTRPTSPSCSHAPRPLHSLLRDQPVIAGIGRTWVDEILHAAQLSPFKRGDDLSDEEAEALRAAMVSELGRALDHYEEQVAMPLPEKLPKPTRVHSHQGEPCPRCEGVLEAVFYEDYVMTYCPHCQTEGRVLKDRRLSRLLK